MSVPLQPTIAKEEGFRFNAVDRPRVPMPNVLDNVHATALHTDALNVGNFVGTVNAAVNPDVFNLGLFQKINPGLLAALSPLGDLTGFTNPANQELGVKYAGVGFNTIFRPQSKIASDVDSDPITNPTPVPGDNILELNLTRETLTFSAPLGSVPNRGSGNQKKIFLNAVPYVQSIEDITFLPATGIHFEPGMWLAVPATDVPVVKPMTYARLASIPHGVTVNAQGTSSGVVKGAPTFPIANINPFFLGAAQLPPTQHPPFFPGMIAANQGTARIPQDLSAFLKSGKITQAMIDNPNSVLLNQLAGQTVRSFVALTVTTDSTGSHPTPASPPQAPAPTTPGIAGGIDEIAFLRGDNTPEPAAANAHAFKMVSIFWLETIEQKLTIAKYVPGSGPITMSGEQRPNGLPPVTFAFTPPAAINSPKTIVATYTQIQYSQMVFLNFNGLTWPHCSVATLVPTQPLSVPASAFA